MAESLVWQFIGFNMLFISLKYVTSSFLAKRLLCWRDLTLDTDIKHRKFSLALYKFTYYTSSIIASILILKDENWIFNIKAFGIPLKSIPMKFQSFYIFELSFYTVEIADLLLKKKQKNFLKLLFHHLIISLFLITSFSKDLIKLGILTIFLQNLSNPVIEYCKIEHYLKNYLASDTIFFIFMIFFIGLRLLIFPRRILGAYLQKLFTTEKVIAIATVKTVLISCIQIMDLITGAKVIGIFSKNLNSESDEIKMRIPNNEISKVCSKIIQQDLQIKNRLKIQKNMQMKLKKSI